MQNAKKIREKQNLSLNTMISLPHLKCRRVYKMDQQY